MDQQVRTKVVLDRASIKAEAKARFKARYWSCVGVVFSLLLLSGAFAGIYLMMMQPYMGSGSWSYGASYGSASFSYGADLSGLTAGALGGLSLLVAVCSMLIGVIGIEATYFFLRVYRGEDVTAGDFFSNLLTGFGRKLGSMLWMGLWLWLWMMLAFVPAVIVSLLVANGAGDASILAMLLMYPLLAIVAVKTYAYSLAPYIIRDCPNVTVREALRLSIRMTRGFKWQLFVLGLSFMGWTLLSGLTLEILALFFVTPYMYAANAGFYHEIKRQALQSGTVTAAELGEPEQTPEPTPEA